MKNINLANLIGAPGHHQYFLTSKQAGQVIKNSCAYICSNGLAAYLQREYPLYRDKRIILNHIGKKYYVVDGNKHLIAMLLAKPYLTTGDLQQMYPGLIRFWECGIENGQQRSPYDIYIPEHIDTSLLKNCRTGYDSFKNPPEKIKIISADVPFDSRAFSKNDRGRTLGETAKALLFTK